MCISFFFNDTATTEIYTLSLHDALPISLLKLQLPRSLASKDLRNGKSVISRRPQALRGTILRLPCRMVPVDVKARRRSEEHTSELQSRQYLVCRLLLEKKKKHQFHPLLC